MIINDLSQKNFAIISTLKQINNQLIYGVIVMPSSFADNFCSAHNFFSRNNHFERNLPCLVKIDGEAKSLTTDRVQRIALIKIILELQTFEKDLVRNGAIDVLQFLLKNQSVYESYIDPEITPKDQFKSRVIDAFENLKNIDFLRDKVLQVKKRYLALPHSKPQRLKSIAEMEQACTNAYSEFTAEIGDPLLIARLERELVLIRNNIDNNHFGAGLFSINSSRLLDELEAEGLGFGIS